ncbi:MAG: SGNH/GDSL hydrolase family protein [Endomicrobiia bacterium]
MIFKYKQKILFQGDSITDSNRNYSSSGLGEGYVFIVAAWLKAIYPQLELEFFNRGISGDTVLDLKNRWVDDCIDLGADVISILIGINDCNKNISNDDYLKSYEEILKLSKQKLKNPYFILMEPFILEIDKYHRKIKKSVEEKCEIVKFLSKKYNGIVVPLYSIFEKLSKIKSPEYWAADGIHPTLQGHFVIALEFLKATGAIDGQYSSYRFHV